MKQAMQSRRIWLGSVLLMVVWFGLACTAWAHYEDEHEPGFAPPPPPLYERPAYPVHPTRPIRPPRVHHRCCRRSRPRVRLDAGKAQLWGFPSSGLITTQLGFLDYHILAPFSGGSLYGGVSLNLISMRTDFWLSHKLLGDISLWQKEWGRMSFLLANRNFQMRLGFQVLRQVEWSLPDDQKQKVWGKVEPTHKNDPDKGDPYELTSRSPMFLLPEGRLFVRFGPLGFEVGGQLNSWDARSYRGDATISLQGRGLRVALSSALIEDAGLFGDPVLLTWQSRTIETKLTAELEVSRFFFRRRPSFFGPIYVSAGLRYRNVMFNRLLDRQEQVIFEEAPGGNFSVAAGLRIGFEMF